MALIDRFPSTSVHQITAWIMAVITWGTGLWKALFGASQPNTEIYWSVIVLAAAYGGWGTLQFWAKRATSWEPPQNDGESAKSPAAGQPRIPTPGPVPEAP